jgi:predicted nuclease with RNAse H fold
MFRKANRRMIMRKYQAFPPTLWAMNKVAKRDVKLTKPIAKNRYKTIEMHSTSTCKALSMPSKDWGKIQTVLKRIGLEGDLERRFIVSYELMWWPLL